MTDEEKIICKEYLNDAEPCKDVISRQTAIDALNEYFARIGKLKKRGLTKGEKAISLDTVGIIKTLPPAQPEQQWIPISERLPKAKCGESDNVLTICAYKDAAKGYRRIKTLYYNGGVWCYPTGEAFEGRVLAWMPLPVPYEE